MKRFLFCIAAALVSAAVISGCASSERPEVPNHASEYDNASLAGEITVSSDKNVPGGNGDSGFNGQRVVKSIEAEAYDFSNGYSYVLALVLKNRSDYDCELSVSVEFFDGDEELVDTSEASVDVFSAGTETALTFYSKAEFKTYTYKMKVREKSEYYGSVNQNLTCEVSEEADKAIISATNNGTTVASYVRATALFFKDDRLVAEGSNYVADNEFEIKPGKTEKCTISCFEDYDSVQVYLNGREIAY